MRQENSVRWVSVSAQIETGRSLPSPFHRFSIPLVLQPRCSCPVSSTIPESAAKTVKSGPGVGF